MRVSSWYPAMIFVGTACDRSAASLSSQGCGRASLSPMTRYRAPFAPDGSSPIDAAHAVRLLETALSFGGEYADLFFEYRAAGSLSYEEGILKSANRGVTMGVGVRVQKGDATGYAF